MAIRSSQRSEADNARLRALAAAYSERHTGMENDVLGWRLAFSLIRAFDLDPRGPSGRLANLALIVAPTTTVVLSQAGREFILRLFR